MVRELELCWSRDALSSGQTTSAALPESRDLLQIARRTNQLRSKSLTTSLYHMYMRNLSLMSNQTPPTSLSIIPILNDGLYVTIRVILSPTRIPDVSQDLFAAEPEKTIP